jgi:6-phosphogluconolactonase
MAHKDTGNLTQEDWRNQRRAEIVRLEDERSFNGYIAEKFLVLVELILGKREDFRVILGGGKTPIKVNKKFVELAGNSDADWTRIIIFFSDERCVPPDHPDSNYNMIRKTLIDPLGIPGKNVYRIAAELGPEKAASKYEKDISNFFGEKIEPVFDLALLGMGTDGHTASLFPGSKVIKEVERYVAPGGKGPEGHERVTLTYTLLNRCKRVWFLMRGEEKQGALRKLIHGPFDPDDCPAQGILPVDGELVYILGDGMSV